MIRASAKLYRALQHIATQLQDTATHCKHCNTLQHDCILWEEVSMIRESEMHCNTLQHIARHFNMTAHCKRKYPWPEPLQCTTLHCIALHRTATHCNTLQHTATSLHLVKESVHDQSILMRSVCIPIRIRYKHIHHSWVEVCCSVLQCVALCCSVLQCGLYPNWHPLPAYPSLLIAVCCSVVQCVAVWCSVMQCIAVWSHLRPAYPLVLCCSVLQLFAECCSVVQCVAVCCSVVCTPICIRYQHIHHSWVALCCMVLPCVAVCYSVLQCVAVCCSVLQCVAVCCIVVCTPIRIAPMLEFVSVWRIVLQCVAVHCSLMQCAVRWCQVFNLHLLPA